MELDEQLRQLADQVPAPPPGDPSATFRRGLRRRRRGQAGRAAAVLVIAGIIGVGTAALVDRPAPVDIANQPSTTTPPPGSDDDSTAPIDGPVVTKPPASTLSSPEPFPWVVAFSVGGDGRWCVTAARGTTEMPDQTGQRCDDQLDVSHDVSWTESPSNAVDGQQLAWGTSPPDTEHVVVEFTDGTRRRARLASGEAANTGLWAIGYEHGDVSVVEAQGAGCTDEGLAVCRTYSTVAIEDGWGIREMLIAVSGLAAILAVVGAATRRMARRRTRGTGLVLRASRDDR